MMLATETSPPTWQQAYSQLLSAHTGRCAFCRPTQRRAQPLAGHAVRPLCGRYVSGQV